MNIKLLFFLIYSLLFEISIMIVNLIWFKYFQDLSTNTRFVISVPLIILSQYLVLKALQNSPSFVVANIFLMFFAITGSYICDYIVKQKMITNIVDIILIIYICFLCVILTLRIKNSFN